MVSGGIRQNPSRAAVHFFARVVRLYPFDTRSASLIARAARHPVDHLRKAAQLAPSLLLSLGL